MRDNVLKGLFTVTIAGLGAYFRVLLVPITMLLIVMILDYLTGLAVAWSTCEINSRRGILGILKKLGYMIVVAAGMVVDWLLYQGLTQININIDVSFCFGLIVTIWLIINELISILENSSKLGLPMPSFLKKIVCKLKVNVEEKGDSYE